MSSELLGKSLLASNGQHSHHQLLAQDAVAVIGIACRFPGASNYNQFWENLVQGTNSITEIPTERWDWEKFYSPDPEAINKTITKWGGFVDDIDKLDAQFFSISPREAMRLDPQQRLLLELTWSCLEDAGYAPSTLSGSDTGVFIGVCSYEYKELLEKYDGDIGRHLGTGNYGCFPANRLSFWFNLHGPSVTTDTACSSSLVTFHQAITALREKECQMALVGGTNTLCAPSKYIGGTKMGLFSSEGRCKTFDAKADGYVRGEGAGVVLVKPLGQAIKDGNRIYGVIRGSAVNHGGAARNITSPSVYAQSKVIAAAFNKAGISPDTVSYIEAHGTGTALGDPIEINGLKRAFRQLYRQQGSEQVNQAYCGLGSVKTNIGHLESAAGVAGVIKILLAMKHKTLPKTNNLEVVNPRIKLAGSPFYLVETTQPWQCLQDDIPRRAGVSSFGFGGANAHLVLEEAPEITPQSNSCDRPLHLLTLSAKNNQALQDLAKRYEEFFVTHTELSPGDVSFTANTGRTHFDHRLALVAESTQEWCKQLQGFVAGKQVTNPPKVAFLFTGQGSQYVNMGRQLYETQSSFRQTLDYCNSVLQSHLDKSLLTILYPENEDEPLINNTAYTQPALFAVEYALAKLWQSWGVQPAVVMGHSVGEYVAACLAGVFSLEDGLKLIAHRGRLMQELPKNGEMVAILAEESKVQAIIKSISGVNIAAFNSPQNIVVSGKSQGIAQVVANLEVQGIEFRKLRVSHAFHSPLMEPMLADFAQVANEVAFSSPQIDLISNVTGKLVTEEIATPEYWCRHITQSVRFADSMRTLREQDYEIFLEVGPKPILIGMGRQCLTQDSNILQWLPSLHPKLPCWQQLLQTLGTLYERGIAVDWAGFDSDYYRQPVELPTYAFQRQRYWIDSLETLVEPTLSPLNSLVQDDREGLIEELKQEESFSAEEIKLLPKLLEVIVAKYQTKVETQKQESTLSQEQQTEILQNLATASAKERLGLLISHLQQQVAAVMCLPSSQLPSPQLGFFQMGLDSMMVVELKTRINNSLGLSLSPNVAFNYPTIEALAGYLNKEIFSEQILAPPDDMSGHKEEFLTAKASQIEDLSEAEMEALMLEKLATL